MKMQVYTIFDSKTEAYIQPFFMQTTAQAKREFIDMVNDGKSAFNKHPEDYILFELGSYENVNAKFKMLDAPVSIGVGSEFVINN